MDKRFDLVCDQCGGMMTLSENRKEMHCEYCGNIVILPDKEQEVQVAYAKRKAELEAQHNYYEKRKKNERKQHRVAKLIALLIVAGIFLIPACCAAIPYIFKPTVNPFDYIEVNFSGKDGKGMAQVELIKTDEKIDSLSDLDITISKQYGLSEGDIITVYTNDFESPCWHSESSREYTVKGLEP